MHSVDDINWDNWQPQVRAVIIYLQHRGQVLLIERLSGMAQNKISAPGGKLEKGETPEMAAVRELDEEVNLQVNAADLELRGLLNFQFSDGYSMLGYVYVCQKFRGRPEASSAARPFWCNDDQLPLLRMWADDPIWLPYVLDGGKITGYFLLRCDDIANQKIVNEELLSYRIKWDCC